jgi:hypothetical protein
VGFTTAGFSAKAAGGRTESGFDAPTVGFSAKAAGGLIESGFDATTTGFTSTAGFSAKAAGGLIESGLDATTAGFTTMAGGLGLASLGEVAAEPKLGDFGATGTPFDAAGSLGPRTGARVAFVANDVAAELFSA